MVLALALGIAASAGSPALAHNVLTDSDPADGATLADGPEQVVLTFLSSLDPDNADLTVIGPDGASVQAAPPDFDGSSVSIPVRTELAGDYLVAFEVLSNDGHWVDGTIRFTVTVGAEPEPSSTADANPAPAAQRPAPGSPGSSPEPVAGEEEGNPVLWTVGALVIMALLVGGFAGYRSQRGRQRDPGQGPPPG